AMVKQMEVSLARTIIRAPFAAVVDSREVELGAYVKDGSPIALLVDEDPYLVVAQVSENDVGRLRPAQKGYANLITGERVEGTIRYIAATAQPDTRTFRVELEVANPDRLMRDGVTAELHFPSERVAAHFISPAALTLDDQGTVGVRCVNAEAKVEFYAIRIVGSSADGMWVAGLPEQVDLIVVGQEYVRQGDRVRVTPDDKGAAAS
ncbi:MAG: HlyD family efflux transporter periplasmic adaptor subunit, partial [Alphaproteobacteria bacterium]|nr:HlyD family efflux transporter periplasmic adaptor subunit [Alphaproteobacteria bacterium]